MLDAAIRELDGARGRAKSLRGEARAVFLRRLAEIDSALLAAVRAGLDEAALRDVRREAEDELAPFRSRMAADAYERSLSAGIDRVIRDRARLPMIALD